MSTLGKMILLELKMILRGIKKIKPIQNSWDKANHFIAFLTLYVTLTLGYTNFKMRTKVLLLLAFGLQIEIVQAFLPNREFSLFDVFADSVGIVFGVFLVSIVYRVFSLLRGTK